MTTWEGVLDELEDVLARQRAALAEAEVEEFPVFTPPADLGPLPEGLAERARALHAESEALERAGLEVLASVGRQLAVTRRLQKDRSKRPVAAFVDQAV